MNNPKQVWSDERIRDALIELSSVEGELTAEDIMFFIHGMRDEYETKLEENQTTVQRVLEENSMLKQSIKTWEVAYKNLKRISWRTHYEELQIRHIEIIQQVQYTRQFKLTNFSARELETELANRRLAKIDRFTSEQREQIRLLMIQKQEAYRDFGLEKINRTEYWQQRKEINRKLTELGYYVNPYT